jgi:hypothetical protein
MFKLLYVRYCVLLFRLLEPTRHTTRIWAAFGNKKPPNISHSRQKITYFWQHFTYFQRHSTIEK